MAAGVLRPTGLSWQETLEQTPLDVSAIQQAIHELTGLPPFADVRLEMDEQAEEYVVHVTPQVEFSPQQRAALVSVAGASGNGGAFRIREDAWGDATLANRLLGTRSAQLLLQAPPRLADYQIGPFGLQGTLVPADQTILSGADEHVVYASAQNGTALLLARRGALLYLAAAQADGQIRTEGVIRAETAQQAQRIMAGYGASSPERGLRQHCPVCGRFMPAQGDHDCPGPPTPSEHPVWVDVLQENPLAADALYDALTDLTGIPDVCAVRLEIDPTTEQMAIHLLPPEQQFTPAQSAALIWLLDADPPARHGVISESSDPAALARLLLAKGSGPPDVGAFLETAPMREAIAVHDELTASRAQIERAQAMYRQALRLAQQVDDQSRLPWIHDALYDFQVRLDWLDVADAVAGFQSSLSGLQAVAAEKGGVPVLQTAEPALVSALTRNTALPLWIRVHNFERQHGAPQRQPLSRLSAEAAAQLQEYKAEVGAFLADLPPDVLMEALSAVVRIEPSSREYLQEHESERRLFCQGKGWFARSTLYLESQRPPAGSDPLREQEFQALAAGGHGDYEAARAQYEQLLATYEQAGDWFGQARVHVGLGALELTPGGDLERAVAFAQRGSDLALVSASQDDRRSVAEVLAFADMVMGSVHLRQGDIQEAQDRFQSALALCREVDDREGEGEVLWSLAQVAEQQQATEPALGYYESAAEIMAGVGNVTGQANARQAQGLLAWQAGQLDRAREYLEQGVQLCEQIEEPSMAAGFRRQLAGVAVDAGNRDAAIAHLRQAAADLRASGKESTAQDVEQQLAELDQLFAMLGDGQEEL